VADLPLFRSCLCRALRDLSARKLAILTGRIFAKPGGSHELSPVGSIGFVEDQGAGSAERTRPSGSGTRAIDTPTLERRLLRGHVCCKVKRHYSAGQGERRLISRSPRLSEAAANAQVCCAFPAVSAWHSSCSSPNCPIEVSGSWGLCPPTNGDRDAQKRYCSPKARPGEAPPDRNKGKSAIAKGGRSRVAQRTRRCASPAIEASLCQEALCKEALAPVSAHRQLRPGTGPGAIRLLSPRGSPEVRFGSDLPDGAPATGEVSRCRDCGYAEYVLHTLEELPAFVADPVFCEPARLIHIRIGNLRARRDD
jgi:hypothetical protein